MATQLFFRDTAADTHLGTNNAKRDGTAIGWNCKALATTRGPGVVASANVATVAGPTNGLEITSGTLPNEWLSPPLAADVTISGTITANLWMSETNMSANVSANVIVDIVRATDNSIVNVVQSTNTAAEVAVTTRAVNNFTAGMTSGAYTGQTANRGDRIRIRIIGDDGGGASMAATYTFNASWSGTAGAADGDSYVTFAETFSFESAPSGSQLFLTNAHSGLTGAPALLSDFTGANESPLSEGGNWANLNTSASALQRISNAVTGSAAGVCHSYWTGGDFGPDLDAYMTISTLSSSVAVAARIVGEGGAATYDGYYVFVDTTPLTGIVRVTNAVSTTLVSTTGVTWASGDKIGFRLRGSLLQVWRQASGSSDWNLILSAVDTTYTAAGKVAIRTLTTNSRLDDFYVATDSNLFTQKAWTSRGAGVVSYRSGVVAGFTSPLLTGEWFTPQLQAFTLTGLAQANIRALESAATVNASLRCELARVDSDGTNATVWASWCMAPITTDAGELGTTEAARTLNISGDDLAISDGQRLRVRLYNDDISTTAMAGVSTNHVQRFYNGTSAAASGDSYLTLAQTIAEYVAGTAWEQPVDDTLSLSDSATTESGKAVAPADTLSLADSLSSEAAFARTLPETLALVDATVFDQGKTLLESLVLDDLLSAQRGISLLLEDTLSLADLADPAKTVGGVDHAQPVDDTLALADSLSSAGVFQRSVDDTLSVADSATTAATIARALADTLTLADAQALTRTIAQAVADTLGLADSATPAAGKGASIADTLTLADALRLDRALTLTETLALTDVLAQAEEIHIGETLALADLATPDLVVGGTGKTAQIDDTLALADALRFGRALTLADTLELVDALASQAALLRSLADTITPADGLQSVSLGRSRAIDDTLLLVDSLASALERQLAIADTLTLADAVAFQAALLRALADTITLADLISTLVEGIPSEAFAGVFDPDTERGRGSASQRSDDYDQVSMGRSRSRATMRAFTSVQSGKIGSQ